MAYTKQGVWLRKMLMCAVINHIGFFCFCLYVVGFKSTLTNLILSFAAYSNQLTLRKGWIVCYFLLLICATISELIYDMGMDDKKNSIQKIGLLINVCVYGVNVWFIGTALLAFHRSGGLRGDKT